MTDAWNPAPPTTRRARTERNRAPAAAGEDGLNDAQRAALLRRY